MTSTIPGLEEDRGCRMARPVMIARQSSWDSRRSAGASYTEAGGDRAVRSAGAAVHELWVPGGLLSPLGMEITRSAIPISLTRRLMAWPGPPSKIAERDALGLTVRFLADIRSFRRALMHEMGQPGVPNRYSATSNWGLPHGDGGGKKTGPSGTSRARSTGRASSARAEKRDPWDVFLDLGLVGRPRHQLFDDCRLFNHGRRRKSPELLRHPSGGAVAQSAPRDAHLSFLCRRGLRSLHHFGHILGARARAT
jgi:hypothetical protein